MSSLGMLTPPGDFGADVVVGEAQSLGLPAAYGGPYLGIFACNKKYMRQMPGRLAGLTVDKNGNRALCLTLSTREQHIRREKATSNICSNQALCALWVTVYLSLMGKYGLKQLAALNYSKAHDALKQIEAIDGIAIRYSAPVYNEFVIETSKDAVDVLKQLEGKNILGGVPLSRFEPTDTQGILVNITEVITKEEIDTFITCLKEVAK
jgi:glycine dehydrogenase subunit 1